MRPEMIALGEDVVHKDEKQAHKDHPRRTDGNPAHRQQPPEPVEPAGRNAPSADILAHGALFARVRRSASAKGGPSHSISGAGMHCNRCGMAAITIPGSKDAI
jgi:hypothetical protein